MSIIDFHSDLKRYSNSDILLMARSEGLSGDVDDLRWMLAIKHSMQSANMNRAILYPLLVNSDADTIYGLCTTSHAMFNRCLNIADGFWSGRLRTEFPGVHVADNQRDAFITFLLIKPVKDLLALLDFTELERIVEDYFRNKDKWDEKVAINNGLIASRGDERIFKEVLETALFQRFNRGKKYNHSELVNALENFHDRTGGVKKSLVKKILHILRF